MTILLEMKKILRSILGKDLNEMNDSELSGKIKEMQDTYQQRKPLSFDELMKVPMEQWGDYDVGTVRFVPAAGVEPCELCSKVSGKCLSLSDAKFYIDHVRKNHRSPLCLTTIPSHRTKYGSGCTLPDVPEEGSPELPGYQVFHQWAEDVFNRDRPPEREE